jgi:16S rRNA (guanine1207-N2)-methyltransferase
MKSGMGRPASIYEYGDVYEITSRLGDQDLRIFTKLGIANWDNISPSSTLLAERVALSHEGRVLLMGCGHGATAICLARKLSRGELWLMDIHCITLELASQTLKANQVHNTRIYEGISLLPEGAGTFDVVVVDLPKGRKTAQRWLIEAFDLLSQGGALYLAGAKDWGIRTAIKDAEEIFGEGSVLAYKKGNRIVRFCKTQDRLPEKGWWRAPGTAPGTWHEFLAETPHGPITMRSLPGVFSYDRTDEGTALLLPFLHAAAQEHVLDLGCGYGIVGLVAALSGAAQVDLVDENLLAIASAQENLRLHQVSGANVYPSDVLSAVRDRSYSLIATNPPFHSGKAVDYRVAQAFIEQSWQALEKGGRFLLVANRFIRYDRLMEKLYPRVEVKTQTNLYQVLQGEKPTVRTQRKALRTTLPEKAR